MSLFGHLLNTSPAPPGVRGDSIASHPFDGPDTEPLLWFRVTFGPRIALRAGPSKSARTVGCLKVDEVVAVSELQDGWGRLASQELPLRATPGNHEAWALIDGTSIGLGPLLQPLEGRFTAAKAVAGAKTRLHDGLCLYLNLTRRSDRRSNMESLFAPHDWLRAAMTRIPSVDGQDLSWPQLVREGLFSQEAWDVARTAESEGQPTIGHEPGSFSAHLTLGGCGCALSHGRAWRALVNSDRSWALILEDDLTAICKNFDEELHRVLLELPESWNMCYLGFHTGRLLPPGVHFEGPLQALARHHGWLPGLWGYLVSRAFARRLLQEAFPLWAQVDTIVGHIATRDIGSYAVPNLQFLLFSPPSEASRDTDVQTFPDDMRRGDR